MKDQHDYRKERIESEMIARAEAKAELEASPERIPCACVSIDAHECARIRDQRGNMPDPFSEETPDDRRACECCCHEREIDFEEFDDYA